MEPATKASSDVFKSMVVLLTSCWTGLMDYHSAADEEINGDLTQSFSDKSRGLLQTSHSTEQPVFSSECVTVDTSNKLDTAEDCKQSYDAQVHVESDKYPCKLCNKKLTHSGDLKCHMRIHAGDRPFSCNVCNKKFTAKGNQKRHMCIHTGERPFSCRFCNKKYTDSSALKCHMLTHRGVRPFSCKVCEKKFTQKCSLTRHIRTHSGVRALSCKVCNKKFTQSSSLKCHTRRMHRTSFELHTCSM